MLKNYLKIAWRNLIKNKASSLINVGGLAVGMAVAMLIGLWIWDELSFNKYHQNYDHIAQVMQSKTFNGTVTTWVATSLPVEEELRKNYGSNFKHTGVMFWTGQHILTVADKKISFSGTYVTPEIPEIFTLKMLNGSRNSLKGPSSILVSQSVARALFGNAEPIGKMVKFDNKVSLAVSGVYEDLPRNTTLHDLAFMASWDYFTSTQDWLKRAATDWSEDSFQVFVQVADRVNMNALSAKIKYIKQKNGGPAEAKMKPELLLQPMSKWHLYAEFKNGVNTGGAIEYVWLFGAIGIFVLLLACINFMNLSTARSEKRAKEVGIRKAVGSVRGQLISQFFCESLLISVIAFGLSLILVKSGLPFFNEVANKDMHILWGSPLFWLMGIGFTLFTGVVAGSYPALYLSSFKPVKVLKGTFKAGASAAIPRKVLVVMQFSVSIILIVGTIVVFNQVQVAKNRPVGYSRAGLINIETNDHELGKQFNAFRQDLIKSGAISEAAQSSSPATRINNHSYDVNWQGKDPGLAVDFATIRITTEYGKTVGWQFKAGRDFSAKFLVDSSKVILNEAAVKYMGLKDPVGQTISLGSGNKPFTVIGVVKDMVMGSPYEPAEQTIFNIGDSFDAIIIRINPQVSTHEALKKIEAICKTYTPDVPFSYQFVDDEYAKKYADEERIGKLSTSFALLAIFISCLGLFGMASFMAEQRTKEIGVRKVLGATVFGLWRLMSKDFVMLVIISLLIATPVSYYFMHNWLQHYTYRAQLSWWIFGATAAGAIIITLLTVSYQSIKAALANPVKSLRSE
jgi:putative ABC transport system permease protein